MKAHCSDGVGERARRLDIMGDIEHRHRPPRQHLEPARQFDADQRIAHRAHVDRKARTQGVERSQGGRGIDELISAAERRIRQPMARSTRTEVAPLHLLCDEAEIDTDSKQDRPDRPRMVDERRRRIRVGADGHAAGAEDAGFLAADVLAREPQVVGVVDRDGRDDRHIGVDDIYSV